MSGGVIRITTGDNNEKYFFPHKNSTSIQSEENGGTVIQY
tara:strand:+ start:176 stop:295 length:120 start_codon:yes stop_codon:yes gene_type:complete